MRPAMERHAQENAIPVGLANAVIRIESNYNAKIVHAGTVVTEGVLDYTANGGRGGIPGDLAIIVDGIKLVDQLGSRMPVPVEIVAFGLEPTWAALEALGGTVRPRLTPTARFICGMAR